MVPNTLLATPIKLVGALCLGIKLGTFFDIPIEVDTSMGLGMVFVNTNDTKTMVKMEPKTGVVCRKDIFLWFYVK